MCVMLLFILILKVLSRIQFFLKRCGIILWVLTKCRYSFFYLIFVNIILLRNQLWDIVSFAPQFNSIKWKLISQVWYLNQFACDEFTANCVILVDNNEHDNWNMRIWIYDYFDIWTWHEWNLLRLQIIPSLSPRQRTI